MAAAMETERDPFSPRPAESSRAYGSCSLASKYSSEKEQTTELNCMIVLQTTLSSTKAMPGQIFALIS